METSASESQIQGLKALKLENDWMQVTLLPDVGGKLFDFIWKPTGKNWLWHNPRIAPQPYPIDANFDNYWCGGWDEGFPTADACDFGGEHFPNLGELRSLKWTVECLAQQEKDAVAKLSAFGPITPLRAEKVVALSAMSPVMRMQYEILNLGPMPFDFLWGTHPALAPTEEMILRIPAKTGIVGLSSSPALGEPGQRYGWPILETPAGRTDMSKTQGTDAKCYCGHYATDLEEGWYAVEDRRTGEGFLLSFPIRECPYLWMWLVYGGWRGYHNVIVEPWTGFPVNLTEAVRQGTSRKLEPGDKFKVEVRATIYNKPETWREALARVRDTALSTVL